MSIFNVKDFGATGNGVQDDFPAFRQALDRIEQENAGERIRGANLFIPSGKYRLSQTLVITRSIILQGAGLASSTLELVKDPKLPANTPVAGIIVQKGKRPDGTETFPDWTIIRQLTVQTPNSFSPPHHLPSAPVADDDTLLSGTSSGIVLYARATIEECHISGFEHDGIHINTSDGVSRNANFWQIRHCFVSENGRHGLFVTGHDSNAGCAIGLLAQVNCRWGIFDQAQFGNTYVGCLIELNGQSGGPNDPPGALGGSIRTKSSASHTFLGLCSEHGQVSVLSYGSMLVGHLAWI